MGSSIRYIRCANSESSLKMHHTHVNTNTNTNNNNNKNGCVIEFKSTDYDLPDQEESKHWTRRKSLVPKSPFTRQYIVWKSKKTY